VLDHHVDTVLMLESSIELVSSTSRCRARWPLRHAAIPSNYRLSQKQSIFTDAMYPTTSV